MKIREKLYRVVEKDTEYFEWYDIMMLICIWVSIVPLIFKEQNKFTYVITIITTLIFVIDYILRWITSDYRLKKGVISFIKYPITFSAIFDLTIIISCFSEFYNNPILTLFSTFRILMIAKTLRYSKKFKIIKNVVEKNKDILAEEEVVAEDDLSDGYTEDISDDKLLDEEEIEDSDELFEDLDDEGEDEIFDEE